LWEVDEKSGRSRERWAEARRKEEVGWAGVKGVRISFLESVDSARDFYIHFLLYIAILAI
jgi:hypothetical protein